MPDKVVSPGDAVGIRSDARWNVPEPELALVINSSGTIVGFTIGNDMSSRDIEGENLLYLPQAKIYARSCAVGPWIVVGATEDEARAVDDSARDLAWRRAGFCRRDARRPDQAFLHRARRVPVPFAAVPHGAVLLTGAGVVPPDSFTLAAGDRVRITISGIGTLENPVAVV